MDLPSPIQARTQVEGHGGSSPHWEKLKILKKTPKDSENSYVYFFAFIPSLNIYFT